MTWNNLMWWNLHQNEPMSNSVLIHIKNLKVASSSTDYIIAATMTPYVICRLLYCVEVPTNNTSKCVSCATHSSSMMRRTPDSETGIWGATSFLFSKLLMELSRWWIQVPKFVTFFVWVAHFFLVSFDALFPLVACVRFLLSFNGSHKLTRTQKRAPGLFYHSPHKQRGRGPQKNSMFFPNLFNVNKIKTIHRVTDRSGYGSQGWTNLDL